MKYSLFLLFLWLPLSHASQTISLGSRVNGQIQKIMVKPGQQVKKGQLLITLDATLWQYEITKTKAELAALKPLLTEANREYQRTQELFEKTLIAEHELALSHQKQIKAHSQFKIAEINLKLAQLKYSYHQIKAPKSGYIVNLHTFEGDLVINHCLIQKLIELEVKE